MQQNLTVFLNFYERALEIFFSNSTQKLYIVVPANGQNVFDSPFTVSSFYLDFHKKAVLDCRSRSGTNSNMFGFGSPFLIFGFGRKAQASGGSKFGYGDVWLYVRPYFEVRTLGAVWKFSVRFLGNEPKFGQFEVLLGSFHH